MLHCSTLTTKMISMLFMILFLTSFEENTVLAQEQCLLSSCPETATIAGLESMDESYSQMLLYILTEDTLITGDYSDLSNETSNLEKSTDQLIQSNKDQDQIISAIDHSIKDMNAKIDYLKKLTVKISKESDLLSQETETLTANATNLTQEGSKLSDEFSNLNNSFTQLAEKSSSLRSVIRKNALIDSEVIIEANECKWVEVNIDIAADAKLGNVFANLLRDGSPIAGGADDAFDIDRGSSVGFVVGNGGTRSRSFVIPEIFETGVHLKVQIDYKDGDYVDVQFSTICYA